MILKKERVIEHIKLNTVAKVTKMKSKVPLRARIKTQNPLYKYIY